MNHEGQFRVQVFENDREITNQIIDDPFVNTTINTELSRWGAFKAIFRPFTARFRVYVSAERAAYGVVFGGDYTPPPPTSETLTTARASSEGERE